MVCPWVNTSTSNHVYICNHETVNNVTDLDMQLENFLATQIISSQITFNKWIL